MMSSSSETDSPEPVSSKSLRSDKPISLGVRASELAHRYQQVVGSYIRRVKFLDVRGPYELLSKLLVSPLISLMVVPYIIPYIIPM